MCVFVGRAWNQVIGPLAIPLYKRRLLQVRGTVDRIYTKYYSLLFSVFTWSVFNRVYDKSYTLENVSCLIYWQFIYEIVGEAVLQIGSNSISV